MHCSAFRIINFGSMHRKNVKIINRYIIAGILIAIHIMITVVPVTTLAMWSTTVMHPISTECSGDCDVCGCSPESRASHTCCCRQKNMKDKQHAGHEGSEANNREKAQNNTETTLSCNCPCENGNLLALWVLNNFESLPYQFNGEIYSPQEGLLSQSFHPHLKTRYCQPPKPPPKSSTLT